jgi:diguanylate cyclase (GGDEF)-like protein
MWFLIAGFLFLLVVALFEKNRQLSEVANKDLLTGLGNKNSLNTILEREISRIDRKGGFLIFLFLDIDNFKHINDTRGHKAGDAVLVEVARRLKKQKRKYDALIRYGGDEFCVVCSQVQTKESGARIREKLKDILQFWHRGEFGEILVEASFGMATYPSDTEDLQQLVALADYRMYQQKQQRKLLRMGGA